MKKVSFYKKTTCYKLTWFGRLSLLILTALLIVIISKTLPVFLSINRPLNGQLLIIDGQTNQYVIEEAIATFNKGHYDKIVTTGSNLPEGFYLNSIKTMAELSRHMLLAQGFDSTKIVTLPTKFVKRNRTFNSANTLNEWIISTHSDVHSVDVLTVGCHARRSLYLFNKALDNHINVGVVNIKHRGYDTDNWWKSSIGARIVISETIAYFYVLITT